MNQKIIDKLQSEYHVDYVKDMLLQKRCHIHFYFTFDESPMIFHIINGDMSLLGMPTQEHFTSQEIISYIKIDNELAEVEGKNSFISDLQERIKSMNDETFIYLPIQNETETIWLYISLQRVKKGNNKIIFGQVLRVLHRTPNDIIHYKKTYQDPLTKLFTRETLKKHLSSISNYEGSYGIYFDIDNFKQVNDVYGHQKGDQLLIDIAQMFINKWEKNVMYYRLGGDEFFIYVYNHTKKDVIDRANTLIRDIENLNEMTIELGVSASVGVIPITYDNNDYHKLLDLGDKHMYISKHRGNGNITLYEH